MCFIDFQKARLTAKRSVEECFAMDEDTAVTDAVIGCAKVIHKAADTIRDFCRSVPKGWPDAGEEKVDVAEAELMLNLSVNAERCGAYLKGVRNALGLDRSREYVNHLIDVAEAIGRARKGGFEGFYAELIPTCINPTEVYGYIKPDEEIAAMGVSPLPEAVKDGHVV